MSISVSIIIPVYNAEQSLPRCIESVINQEFTDWELILVNDGSSDSSGKICDEYAQKDERVKVIHKDNSGVSDSRNLALCQAKGDYIQFIDSDDWITTDATNLLYKTAISQHCDMVISDFYRVVGQRLSQKGDIDDDVILTREEFAAHMMENPADFYYGVLWNKFFKREIIEKYQLRMDSKISWCEDFMFNLEYIRHAESFYALHVPIYYYVKTKGSLASQGMSLTKTISMKKMVFAYYHNFYKSVLTEEDYEKNRLQVYRFLVDAASDGIVPPSFLLGAKKLGDERKSAVTINIDVDGILFDEYRDRKLLDRYLEQVALKNDLKLTDVRLLMYLNQLNQDTSKKELCDFTNLSWRRLTASMQRLSSRGYIKVEDIKNLTAPKSSKKKEKNKDKHSNQPKTNRMRISLLPCAEPIIISLSTVQNDYEQAKYADFTDDELVLYAYLSNKIKNNIQKILM